MLSLHSYFCRKQMIKCQLFQTNTTNINFTICLQERMKGDYGQQQQTFLRNSYGFQSTPSRVFHPSFKPPQGTNQELKQPQRKIGDLIKSLQNKIEGVESLASKRRDISSGILHDSEQPKPKRISSDHARQPFRPYIGLPEEMRGIDLRGSCPNIIKRDQMRNTITISQQIPAFQLPHKEISLKKNQFSALEQTNRSRLGNSSVSIKEVEVEKTLSKQSAKINKEKFIVNNSSTNIPNRIAGNGFHEKRKGSSLNELIAKTDQIKNKLNQMTRNRVILLGGFQLIRLLGKGKFGQVFLAKHVETGFIVALKKIAKSKVYEQKMIEQLTNEIRLHSSLIHPNIVRFFGMFQEPEHIYLIMEYMNGGTLFDRLNEKEYLPVKQAVEYLRDTILALQYLHDRSIAHRDIKPENIVLSSEGVAKLCDFGWSALVENSRKTYCGTFDYAPPEILQRKDYDTSVDIWCIGVLTYEILTGKVPFQGDRRNVIMDKIINVDKNTIEFPAQIPEDARTFIESLVRKNPEERPKCKDLLKFPFFVNNPPASKTKKMV